MHSTSFIRRRSARLLVVAVMAAAALGAGIGAVVGAAGSTGGGPIALAPATPIPTAPPVAIQSHDPVGVDPGVIGGGGGSDPNAGGAQRVDPEPGILDPRPAGIDHFVVSKDGTTVDVFYWGGVEACYGLAGARADWLPDGSLDIEVLEGRRAGVDGPCIDLALLKVVTLPLVHDLPRDQ